MRCSMRSMCTSLAAGPGRMGMWQIGVCLWKRRTRLSTRNSATDKMIKKHGSSSLCNSYLAITPKKTRRTEPSSASASISISPILKSRNSSQTQNKSTPFHPHSNNTTPLSPTSTTTCPTTQSTASAAFITFPKPASISF